jgi:hypothetical protein
VYVCVGGWGGGGWGGSCSPSQIPAPTKTMSTRRQNTHRHRRRHRHRHAHTRSRQPCALQTVRRARRTKNAGRPDEFSAADTAEVAAAAAATWAMAASRTSARSKNSGSVWGLPPPRRGVSAGDAPSPSSARTLASAPKHHSRTRGHSRTMTTQNGVKPSSELRFPTTPISLLEAEPARKIQEETASQAGRGGGGRKPPHLDDGPAGRRVLGKRRQLPAEPEARAGRPLQPPRRLPARPPPHTHTITRPPTRPPSPLREFMLGQPSPPGPAKHPGAPRDG